MYDETIYGRYKKLDPLVYMYDEGTCVGNGNLDPTGFM